MKKVVLVALAAALVGMFAPSSTSAQVTDENINLRLGAVLYMFNDSAMTELWSPPAGFDVGVTYWWEYLGIGLDLQLMIATSGQTSIYGGYEIDETTTWLWMPFMLTAYFRLPLDEEGESSLYGGVGFGAHSFSWDYEASGGGYSVSETTSDDDTATHIVLGLDMKTVYMEWLMFSFSEYHTCDGFQFSIGVAF